MAGKQMAVLADALWHRLILALLFFALLPTFAHGQSYFDAATIKVSKELRQQWTLRGLCRTGYGCGSTSYWAGNIDCGAGYKLSEAATIAVYAKCSFANYIGISNKDVEISISESISWRRASGLFFGFYFEQRRLFYNPTGYTKNVSSCGGIVGVERMWDKTQITGRVGCQAICNLKSQSTKAEFVQRVKIPVSIRKGLTPRLAIGIDYTYSIFGEHQVFIADKNGLNTLSVAVDFKL